MPAARQQGMKDLEHLAGGYVRHRVSPTRGRPSAARRHESPPPDGDGPAKQPPRVGAVDQVTAFRGSAERGPEVGEARGSNQKLERRVNMKWPLFFESSRRL